MAYIPNYNNFSEINHIDENPSNNNVLNLEWCDRSYNINYGNRNFKCSIKQINNGRSKKVYQYDLKHNLIKIWDSVSEASRIYKTRQSSISNCCLGRTKKHKNFIWKYE